MRALLSLALCLSLCSLSQSSASSTPRRPHFVLDVTQGPSREAFAAWGRHNGAAYGPGGTEFEARLPHFEAAVAHLLRTTAKGAATLPVNALADLSREEFQHGFLGQRDRGAVEQLQGLPPGVAAPFRYGHLQPPRHVDWRKKGIIGPVKDQHVNRTACGCCWSFAATGVMECLAAMASGNVVALSEQQLIDCDKAGPYFDIGCQGGDFEGGILYATELGNGGLDTEADYPYRAADLQCRTNRVDRRVATMDGLVRVPHHNETALQQAVSQHPVAVAVCCGDFIENWHHYTGGLFDIPGADIPGGCTEPLDHAMVVVGYGTTRDGQDYWIVKNSWNEGWGEDGFGYLPRNVGPRHPKGAFGLATAPGFPLKRGVNSASDPFLDFAAWEKPSSSGAGTDGVERDSRCLDWTLQHVYRAGDVVHLLHVVESAPGSSFFENADEQRDLRVEQARGFIQERFVSRCDKAKVPSHVTILQQSGGQARSVGEAICVHADALKAAAIAMAPHNRGPLVRFIQGGATAYCIRHARRTVLVTQLAPTVQLNLHRKTIG